MFLKHTLAHKTWIYIFEIMYTSIVVHFFVYLNIYTVYDKLTEMKISFKVGWRDTFNKNKLS